jgi:hypothetical protein
MEIFVPFSEPLADETGMSLGRLVPFKLEYRCLRLAGWEAVEIGEDVSPEPFAAELQAS